MEISKAILKVIEGDFNQVALLNDQTERPISVVSVSRNHDLALILVTASAHPPLSIRDPETLIPGERLFAIADSIASAMEISSLLFNTI